MTETRFDACLGEVLRHEGGYVDHPSDPGGATNMGITRKTLARWRKVSPWWDLPKTAVRSLTVAEAGRIYRASYWEAVKAERMPHGLDLALFDYAVNSGPDRAVRTLQALTGVKVDGQVGPLTLDAVRSRKPADLVTALCDQRMGFLRQLASFPTFGRGWTSRVAAIRKAALDAAGGTISTSIQRRSLMDILNGYRTYIVAALMLVAGLAQVLGIDMPTLEGSSAGHLIMEALAVIFLRKGLKADISRA